MDDPRLPAFLPVAERTRLLATSTRRHNPAGLQPRFVCGTRSNPVLQEGLSCQASSRRLWQARLSVFARPTQREPRTHMREAGVACTDSAGPQASLHAPPRALASTRDLSTSPVPLPGACLFSDAPLPLSRLRRSVSGWSPSSPSSAPASEPPVSSPPCLAATSAASASPPDAVLQSPVPPAASAPAPSSAEGAADASASNTLHVVYIIGPTGVGKTRLGVELCLALQQRGQPAEIISADSMQVYRGCDIATAKATAEEQKLVPHHLLDICDVGEHFSVLRFLRLATKKVSDLQARGVVPVVVGGTQLYLQHLLWRSLLDRYLDASESDKQHSASSRSRESLEKFSDAALYDKLKALDPERAAQLHPRDRRRVIRSIETTQSTGVPHSELMRREREASIQEGLRYPSCILWLDCRDGDIHQRRLETRVDQMLQHGLLRECGWVVDTLGVADRWLRSDARGGQPLNEDEEHARLPEGQRGQRDSTAEASGQKAEGEGCGKAASEESGNDQDEDAEEAGKKQPGVLQSIGYKEFVPLLLHQRHDEQLRGAASSSSPRSPPASLASGSSCRFGCPAGTLCPPTVASSAACLVLRSRQYAKKQRRWIINKFLLRQQNLPLYLLDTSNGENPHAWEKEIRDPATRIVEDFLRGAPFKEDHPYAAAAHLSDREKARRETLRALSQQGPDNPPQVGIDPWVDGGLNG
ncbi:tRNA dimethylallyltransferase [Besnoitia besnoiti]|uniref:tRNA dimethylallyltransferase n=1 Tax=Besnoitia besnoiti TaxID=94643 RepID=A0A2A9M8A0_BESBE|nr:tRNA dimethylallyltransferase [Besnoitia besnoiti]PFH34215.1 tRNA dimethylallyltransferase [Besnoitia besnoiti]